MGRRELTRTPLQLHPQRSAGQGVMKMQASRLSTMQLPMQRPSRICWNILSNSPVVENRRVVLVLVLVLKNWC
jgi:hypothetical protein